MSDPKGSGPRKSAHEARDSDDGWAAELPGGQLTKPGRSESALLFAANPTQQSPLTLGLTDDLVRTDT